MAEIDNWTSQPDRSLQRFDKIRDYVRSGRIPWRRHRSGVAEELRTHGATEQLKRMAGGRARLNPLRPARSTTREIYDEALHRRFSDEMTLGATSALAQSDPASSARRLLSAGQTLTLAVIFLGVAVAFAAEPLLTLIALNTLATAYFIAVITFRLYLAAVGLTLPAPAKQYAAAGASITKPLPMITVLLPLFDEADALPALAEAIGALDYPVDRLDVKLLLEAGDNETADEARRLRLDKQFDLIIVPSSHPQTKPKACNYGLYCAQGDFVVIYDAEDRPESDQLKKAVAVFSSAPDDLACLQAQLTYYNADENWLTRLFTLEYSLWFDSLLPALEKLKAPIPLGGTSNIFRTDILTAIGGWDPYNVTEDADLGLRLARKGYRTEILDSTTFEEANCDVANWLRQRSRWMKGYMQTWFVHMRDPAAFGRVAGWRGAAATHLFVAGNVFSALINPVLWGVFIFWIATRSSAVSAVFPGPLLHLNLIALLLGNFLFVYLAIIAPLKRGWAHLSASALLMPVYWWLTSIAAYMAVWQLLTRPSFWEKTHHTLSRDAKALRDAAISRIAVK